MLLLLLLLLDLLTHRFSLTLSHRFPIYILSVNLFLLRLLWLRRLFLLLFLLACLCSLIFFSSFGLDYFGCVCELVRHLQVPVALLHVVLQVAPVVASVRPAAVNHYRLQIVIHDIRVCNLRGCLLTLSHVLGHVELHGELKPIVNLQSVERLHVVLCTIETDLQNRGTASHLFALRDGLLRLARFAVEIFDLLVRVEFIDSLVHVFVAFHLAGDIQKLFRDVSALAADVASKIASIAAKEHIVNQMLLIRALQRLLDRIKENAVELVHVLLLHAVALPPAKRLRK